MISGVLYGVAAGMIWGLVYLVPMLLADYDPLVISFARYTVFGALSVILALRLLPYVRKLTRRDWVDAVLLGVVGNIFYYWVLIRAVQCAGAPVAGAFTAVIPISVALCANALEARGGGGRAIAWKKLAPPLTAVFAGMVMLNWTEFHTLVTVGGIDPGTFRAGVFFAVLALVLWTWYPIANARWLMRHRAMPATVGTAMQGLGLFPVALLGFLWECFDRTPAAVLGPNPLRFLFLMLVLGFLCSWVGIVFWNEMSRRLPAALGGQLIVFETIFAVIYTHLMRREWPTALMAGGMALLLAGVLGSIRAFQQGMKTSSNCKSRRVSK